MSTPRIMISVMRTESTEGENGSKSRESFRVSLDVDGSEEATQALNKALQIAGRVALGDLDGLQAAAELQKDE